MYYRAGRSKTAWRRRSFEEGTRLLSAWTRQTRIRTTIRGLALLCGADRRARCRRPRSAAAQNPPPQEPGVTLRVFQLGRAPSELCTLKAGPDAERRRAHADDRLDRRRPLRRPDAELRRPRRSRNLTVADRRPVHVPAQQRRRLPSCSSTTTRHRPRRAARRDRQGRRRHADRRLHALRIELLRGRRRPAAHAELAARPATAPSAIVPNSVLSTDAGVVRVTAPGHARSARAPSTRPATGCRSTASTPATTSSTCAPAGFEPKVTGLEWLRRRPARAAPGATTTATRAASPPRARSGSSPASRPPTTPPTVTRTKDRRGPQGADGHQGRRRRDLRLREGQLTKLVDTDGDGVSEAKYQTVATWPFDGNFHEFAFGLLYKDGFFYLNLSVSIDLGGATTVPQGSRQPRHHLKVNKDTGAVEYVAGGLRTPHGIGWGPEDGSSSPTTRAAGCPPRSWSTSSRAGSSTTTRRPTRPGRFDNQPVDAAGALDPAERDRQLAEPRRCSCRAARTPVRCHRRRDLRRPPARLPGEGQRRVPGRAVPHDPGPGGRRHARSARPRRRDLSSAASAPAATGARRASSATACRSSPRTAP